MMPEISEYNFRSIEFYYKNLAQENVGSDWFKV